MTSKRTFALAFGLMAGLPFTAIAADPPPAPTQAPASGKQLVQTCTGCHGVTGYRNAYPNFHVPRIGGQSKEYLMTALTEYKEGKRKHGTMQAQAQAFSDADIEAIATYLSTLGKKK